MKTLGAKKSLLSFGRKPRASNGEMELQITSMADIFTILLVFLLKSYATSAVNISPTAGLKLPLAQAETREIDALKVEVSKSAISVENEIAVTLDSFKVATNDLQNNGVSRSLASAIEKARSKQIDQANNNTEVKVDSKIIIIADEGTPYATIKTVLASAAIHGFTDFKLAVVSPN